jgi:septal ring factor EnvC (AmiA/AmiB activator)
VKPTAALAILALSATLGAQDADRARAEALAARAAERLKVLHQEADRLASEARTLLGDLRKIELERQIKEEEFRRVDAQADAVRAELAALDDEVRRIEAQEARERPDIQARLVELYKLGGARYLRMMLSLSDIRHVGQATRMVAALARLDQDRIAAHQRRREELATARLALEERTRTLAALRTDAARARTAADRAVEERNALIHDIDERRDLNAQLAGELQAAGQSLQVRLKELTEGAPVGEPPALPLKPFQGDLEWPVNGTVRERFGRAANGARAPSNGIEIAAPEGVPVKAVHDGSVAFADTFAGFGNLVILDHGGQNFSIYGNLLEMAVTRGARIDRGQTVGSVGPSVAGTAGLHFELRVDGRPVDPLQWFGQAGRK